MASCEIPSLPVISLAQYLTDTASAKWRQADWNSWKLCKAIKGEPIKGYADFPLTGGKSYHLIQQTVPRAVELWAAWAANVIKKRLGPPVRLVPIPNSGAHVGNQESKFRTLELAEAVAAALQRIGHEASAHARLRWIAPTAKAHEGGPRNPPALLRQLAAVGPPIPAGELVLVDDIVTFGGHMLACAEKLASEGRRPRLAVTVGRRFRQQLPNPMKPPELILTTVEAWFAELGSQAGSEFSE